MDNITYIKKIIFNYLKKKVKINSQLQRLYDSNVTCEKPDYEMMLKLQEYNLSQPIPYLASGMSCYFNNQVEKYGLSNLKLAEQDKDDAKFIASCFGKVTNYSENGLSVLYTTLLGTTELSYGMQTFPAGIYEDVFQCSADHSLPIQLIFGESESDYYCRVIDYKISQYDSFPLEKRDEVLYRAKRLASKFCNGKNRIYLLPINNVLNNKASFGDVPGLRDGLSKNENLKKIVEDLLNFDQLLEYFSVQINSPYNDPNMTSQFGIAIYGDILVKEISFFEVDRVYDLIQRRAKELGYVEGSYISINKYREVIPSTLPTDDLIYEKPKSL